MSLQQDARRPEPVTMGPMPTAPFANTGLTRTGLRWIAARPAYIRVAATITLVFALVVAVISLIIGVPFSVPNERVSMALGFQAVVPLGWGMATYLFVQGYRALRKEAGWSGREIAGNLANDGILIVLFVAANYVHFNLKGWIPLVNPALFDVAYMASDEALRPLVDAFAWASTTIRANLNPEIRWYQFLFLIMFILSFCRFAAVRDSYYPYFAVSMLLMTSLGALSYLIAPALGPFIYEEGTSLSATEAQSGMYVAYQSVRAEGAVWLEQYGADYFTGALAAMPSLHVGYASLMTYYLLKCRDYMAPLFVLFWLWILVDSVALRWHYAIDAPAGIALCAVVVWLTNRLLAPSGGTRTKAP